MNANQATARKGRENTHVKKFSMLLPGFFFLLLSFVAVRGFVGIFAPPAYTPPLEAYSDYRLDEMLTAIQPDAVRVRLDEIAALGSRFVGSEGFYECERLIQRSYQDAGLELHQQSIRTTAPQTEFSNALNADGSPAAFNVYPFMPNHYQPVATSDEGVTATVLRVDDDILRTRSSFSGCFALLDGSSPAPTGYGYDYTKYAQLGFEGLIISHPEGLDKVPWAQADKMVSLNPVNFLRVAADASVFDAVNKEITLRVRVRYGGVLNRTVVGVMRGQGKPDEALIIPVSYDALSMLPDRSPGMMQALPLAIHLQLLEGMQSHRAHLRRDVIFVAFGGHMMAQDSQDKFMSAVGAQRHEQNLRAHLETRLAENAADLARIQECRDALAPADVLVLPDATRTALKSLETMARGVLDTQLQYVLDTRSLELSEEVLAAKIAFEKRDASNVDSPEFARFQSAKKRYDQSFSAAGLDLLRLLEDQAGFANEMALRRRVLDRLAQLSAYHLEQAEFIAQSLDINAVFSPYSKLIVFSSEFAAMETESSGNETITFSMGSAVDHSNGGQAAYDAIRAAIQQLGIEDKIDLRFSATKNYGSQVRGRLSDLPLEAGIWARVGHPAYSVVHPDRSYKAAIFPAELSWMRNVDSLKESLKVAGATALYLAYGNGSFTPLKFNPIGIYDFRGNVYVANVGQSIIPNYPLAHAVVGCKELGKHVIAAPNGRYTALLEMTNPYGRYDRSYAMGTFSANSWDYGPDAVGYDADGVINMIKDEGPKAQRTYVSMHLLPEGFAGRDVNVVCYRAAPVTLLDLINPQSLKSYAGANFIRRRGLNAFDSTYAVHPSVTSEEGILTTFIKPDEYFYVELKAGAADNPLVQTTRAFLLGTATEDPALLSPQSEAQPSAKLSRPTPGNEIRGSGYLAGETPLIRDVAAQAARSMIAVNQERLNVQNHYGMADERTQDFQNRAIAQWVRTENSALSQKRSTLSARDAVTYATLNHPVLRRNIYEAVAGILWYLGLLVPFTFFFEKLVFGFSDVRKQLGAHVVIFLVVFMLLKWLHPAFAMIRSSIMILLGFIILMISTGILAMFSSRFKENLEGLKKQRGQVTAAEVNKVGAIVTAFMLGLNNMHRRRVRTMLTCGTLVLITFVLICFTSVQNDIVDSSISVGKAPFQGFVVKNEQYRSVSPAELFALQTKFGEQYIVAPRRAFIGSEDGETRRRQYPEIRVSRQDGERVRAVNALSILTWSPEEPLARFLVSQEHWFTKIDASHVDGPVPVLISKGMAGKLGISNEMLDGDFPPVLEVNGAACSVRGIFAGEMLDGLLDFDGYNLLPFDIKALRELNGAGGEIIADVEEPRISGNDVIIAPRELGVSIASGMDRILSVAVALPESLSPKESREVIEQFMEQSGRRTYFGLDGYAFLGKRARESSFVGLIDMLIPLIIAAITVLNTIRGSVYERKEEIFVYNAVGIAPRHIFFMFFAEAFVYAVVGSVLGYILSQGTGKLLTAIHLTGGLNMTFTSLGTIYASLAVAGSVFISTLFPARTAMKIASPSSDQGWRLPEPDGDTLSFKLPFTFDWHDRIAVLAFFRRYFTDHAEGSSGRFFTGSSTLGVAEETDPLNGDGYIPTIVTPVWLKPFDLGVSQELRISLPTDPETGEYVAQITLTRLSGTQANWKRLNRLFVSLLRSHFLHWRAVAPEERAVMFQEARSALNVVDYEKGNT